MYVKQTRKKAIELGKSCANCDSCRIKSHPWDFIPMIGCGYGHGVYDTLPVYRVSFYGLCRHWAMATKRAIDSRVASIPYFKEIIEMKPEEQKTD